ncbi:MAG: hypothetical protein A3K12_05575 [Candidatus Rokubacteria bacterium RIFCSPLOWO2_12_FULL_71_19]|nr:MAG: hypothetical protein A3K12_05575 [Candidatus Rokubacteria bacterium RIFCSPLOWO2_12_FULL_71_19]
MLPRAEPLVLALVVGVALLHLATAGIPDVFDELPGQYATTAWEMVESGNWLVPTLEGVPRLQKPPLVYWLTAFSLRLLGHGEFAARLPTALALAGLMAVTWALASRLHGSRRAAISAVVLGTSFGTVGLGKLIMPEPFLALGIASTLYCVVRAVEKSAHAGRWACAAWVAAALACLSKGLHGLLLPAGIVLATAAIRPALWRSLRPLARPAGVGLFLALLLPWPLYIETQFPGYLRDNLVNEQVGHVLDTHFPRDSAPTPLAMLWLQHLAWWFPWALFAAPALLMRSRRVSHPAAALPVLWLLAIAAGVSLAGQRQDYYTMSAWPAFALLLGRAWDDEAEGRASAWALGLALAALAALGLAAAGLGLAVGAGGSSAGAASAPFEARNSIRGAVSGIASAQWAPLAPLLLPVGGGLFLGGAAGLALAARRRTRHWSWLPVALGTLPLLLAAMVGMQAVAPYFGLKSIGAALEAQGAATGLVVFDGPSHRASSLSFYTEAPLRWVHRAETEFATRSRGVGAERFVEEEEIVRRWRAGAPVWLVTEESHLPHWRGRLDGLPGEVVGRSGTRVLLTNRLAQDAAGEPGLSPRADDPGR